MRMHTKQTCSEIFNSAVMPEDPWTPEHLPPLELAQVVEDCLFAYVNAQSQHARDMMWPMVAETVEALIAESRRRFACEHTLKD
ncbi:MAG: hypothetical protein HQL75_18165 [Magnetococcales bacterium]|nr:hypothetical protein [Magnetococcales bacterium]